ncbi:MAG: redoxin domain-containing protein, partial [Acidobacteria bacterium]|nr:redoxin domain-containing protein [Acidobacteriota bacterium]
MELQDRLEDLRAQGLGVAAISYDTEEVLAAFAERRGVKDVPLLSDDDSAAIRAFGIYNHIAEEGIGPNADDPDVKADVNQYVSVFGANPMIVGTPFPGTFIVDREGRVTSRFFEEFYRERNTAANIML